MKDKNSSFILHPSSFPRLPLSHPLLQVAEAGRGRPHRAARRAAVLLVLGHGSMVLCGGGRIGNPSYGL
jgi:hypothetical protein